MWSVEVHMFSHMEDSSCSKMSCGHHDQHGKPKGFQNLLNSHERSIAMMPASFNQDSLSKSSLQDVQLVDEIAPDVFFFNGPWSPILETCRLKPLVSRPPHQLSSSPPHQFFQGQLVQGAPWPWSVSVPHPPAFLKVTREKITSWWLNPPIWKICSSKWESSPNRDENNKSLKPPPRLCIIIIIEIKPWIDDGFTMIRTLEHPSFPNFHSSNLSSLKRWPTRSGLLIQRYASKRRLIGWWLKGWNINPKRK